MEPTLEEAVSKLFGSSGNLAVSPSVQQNGTSSTGPGAGSSDIAIVIQSARVHYDRSQEALRSGDWGRYGEEQRALEADLRRLAELTAR
jgi:hypothetical protein